MYESLAFNCLFLSPQSLSSNEQGAIFRPKIIIYSSYPCCLGIYTHDLLEIRKKNKKTTLLGGRPLLATVCSAGGALSEPMHNTRSFSTLRSRLRLREMKARRSALIWMWLSSRLRFPTRFTVAPRCISTSQVLLISLVQNLFTFRQVQGQVPHLAPQYGYSIPYNESEHGGQINPAPPTVVCWGHYIAAVCSMALIE